MEEEECGRARGASIYSEEGIWSANAREEDEKEKRPLHIASIIEKETKGGKKRGGRRRSFFSHPQSSFDSASIRVRPSDHPSLPGHLDLWWSLWGENNELRSSVLALSDIGPSVRAPSNITLACWHSSLRRRRP